MNCTTETPCLMCQLDAVPQDIEPQPPTPLESGMAGMAIAFSVWSAIAIFGAIAAWVQKYDAVTGSLVICLGSGFLYGVWARLRR